jgi:hypothetical protein
LVGGAGWLVRRRRCTTPLYHLAALGCVDDIPSFLATTRAGWWPCRRAVKVEPSACAARTADAAPLTAHRSRACSAQAVAWRGGAKPCSLSRLDRMG